MYAQNFPEYSKLQKDWERQYHNMISGIAFLMALALCLAAWAHVHSPQSRFLGVLKQEHTGMEVSWDRQGDVFTASVAVDNGWENTTPLAGHTVPADRVVLAQFTYPNTELSIDSARALQTQLAQDVQALSTGRTPASFEGFGTTTPLNMLWVKMIKSSPGDVYIAAGMMGLLLVLAAFELFLGRRNTFMRHVGLWTLGVVSVSSLLIAGVYTGYVFYNTLFLTPIG